MRMADNSVGDSSPSPAASTALSAALGTGNMSKKGSTSVLTTAAAKPPLQRTSSPRPPTASTMASPQASAAAGDAPSTSQLQMRRLAFEATLAGVKQSKRVTVTNPSLRGVAWRVTLQKGGEAGGMAEKSDAPSPALATKEVASVVVVAATTGFAGSPTASTAGVTGSLPRPANASTATFMRSGSGTSSSHSRSFNGCPITSSATSSSSTRSSRASPTRGPIPHSATTTGAPSSTTAAETERCGGWTVSPCSGVLLPGQTVSVEVSLQSGDEGVHTGTLVVQYADAEAVSVGGSAWPAAAVNNEDGSCGGIRGDYDAAASTSTASSLSRPSSAVVAAAAPATTATTAPAAAGHPGVAHGKARPPSPGTAATLAAAASAAFQAAAAEAAAAAYAAALAAATAAALSPPPILIGLQGETYRIAVDCLPPPQQVVTEATTATSYAAGEGGPNSSTSGSGEAPNSSTSGSGEAAHTNGGGSPKAAGGGGGARGGGGGAVHGSKRPASGGAHVSPIPPPASASAVSSTSADKNGAVSTATATTTASITLTALNVASTEPTRTSGDAAVAGTRGLTTATGSTPSLSPSLGMSPVLDFGTQRVCDAATRSLYVNNRGTRLLRYEFSSLLSTRGGVGGTASATGGVGRGARGKSTTTRSSTVNSSSLTCASMASSSARLSASSAAASSPTAAASGGGILVATPLEGVVLPGATCVLEVRLTPEAEMRVGQGDSPAGQVTITDPLSGVVVCVIPVSIVVTAAYSRLSVEVERQGAVASLAEGESVVPPPSPSANSISPSARQHSVDSTAILDGGSSSNICHISKSSSPLLVPFGVQRNGTVAERIVTLTNGESKSVRSPH